MRNTLALLALFGLFTTGSAAATTCQNSGTHGAYCVEDKVVGTCANGAANCTQLDKPCSGKAKYAPCGDLTSNSVVGYCSAAADAGVCHTAKFVKVAYTVRTPKTDDALEIGDDLQEPDFNMQLATHIGRPVTKQTRICDALASENVANGAFSCPTDPTQGCSLLCTTDSFGIFKPNDYVCKGTKWEGDQKGACAKRCPVLENDGTSGKANNKGALSADKQTVTYTDKVTNGDVICKNPQGLFGGPSCTLKCDANFRASVTTPITYACTGGNASSPTFVGDLPTCTPAYVVEASVNVALKDTEEFDDIKDSKAFKDSFKTAVAANFGAVAAHHVRVSGITEAANRRRLLELNNVDGTHSPEDDGGLPVGGGLRGVR